MKNNKIIIWADEREIKSTKSYIIKSDDNPSGYPVGTWMLEVEFENEIKIEKNNNENL